MERSQVRVQVHEVSLPIGRADSEGRTRERIHALIWRDPNGQYWTRYSASFSVQRVHELDDDEDCVPRSRSFFFDELDSLARLVGVAKAWMQYAIKTEEDAKHYGE